MAVTGHKSKSSLKHYARTNNAKKKEMSTVIAETMQENDPMASVTENTDEDITDDLKELNFNIQTASSSKTQHFHFHGPVVFNNK